MIFSKFIIETDEELNKVLIIGRCTYHKQLAYDINNVISGGIWMYIDDKTIQFSGESYDFGRANVNDIKECIKNGHVYTSYICDDPIVDKYKFIYMDICGDIEVLN